MARRKKIKRKSRGFKEKIHWGESYTSLFLGIIVVAVAVFIVILFSKHHPIQEVSSTHTENLAQVQVQEKSKEIQKTYTVKPGDDLWTISENIYKSGYNWVDIARENNLSDPGLIFSGMKLKIPNVKPIIVKISVNETQINSPQKSITSDAYIVVEGDNLWDISVRAYGDGYKWVDIARANSLDNPDLIFSENILKIPR